MDEIQYAIEQLENRYVSLIAESCGPAGIDAFLGQQSKDTPAVSRKDSISQIRKQTGALAKLMVDSVTGHDGKEQPSTHTTAELRPAAIATTPPRTENIGRRRSAQLPDSVEGAPPTSIPQPHQSAAVLVEKLCLLVSHFIDDIKSVRRRTDSMPAGPKLFCALGTTQSQQSRSFPSSNTSPPFSDSHENWLVSHLSTYRANFTTEREALSGQSLPAVAPHSSPPGVALTLPNWLHDLGDLNLNVGAARERRMSEVSIQGNQFNYTKKARIDEEDDGTIQINQYILMYPIGRGAQGTVMLGMDTDLNELRAVKVIDRSKVLSRDRLVQGPRSMIERKLGQAALVREVAIMKKCRHENIVSLYEVIDDPAANSLYLVLQYVEHGPVTTLKPSGQATRCIHPSTLISYARQLFAGLHYLHNHRVAHRDIKPENILLGANDKVYLADFGVSELFDVDSPDMPLPSPQHSMTPRTPMNRDRRRKSVQILEHLESGGNALANEGLSYDDRSSTTFKSLQQRPSLQKGTIAFFSPELFAIDLPTDVIDMQKCDVYALALTIYVLLYGQLPWELESYSQYRSCVLEGAIPFPAETPLPCPRKKATAQQAGSMSGDGPPSPRRLPKVPLRFAKQWQEWLSGALHKDPRHRWSVAKIRDAIKQLQLDIQHSEDADFLKEPSSPTKENESNAITLGVTMVVRNGQEASSSEVINKIKAFSAFEGVSSDAKDKSIPSPRATQRTASNQSLSSMANPTPRNADDVRIHAQLAKAQLLSFTLHNSVGGSSPRMMELLPPPMSSADATPLEVDVNPPLRPVPPMSSGNFHHQGYVRHQTQSLREENGFPDPRRPTVPSVDFDITQMFSNSSNYK